MRFFLSEFEVKTMLVLYKFDCNKKKMGELAETYCNEEGETVYEIDNEVIEMNYVRPDTVGEEIFKRFCKSNK